MNASTEFIVVTTTSDQANVVHEIARQVVDRHLAACAQVGGPLTSYFRWECRVDRADEWTCSVKTTWGAWPQVCKLIRSLHNYQEPQIIALPILDGSPSYLQWIRDSVDSRAESSRST